MTMPERPSVTDLSYPELYRMYQQYVFYRHACSYADEASQILEPPVCAYTEEELLQEFVRRRALNAAAEGGNHAQDSQET